MHVHQSLVYVHACIAFDPCMCVYVNRQHKPYASMVTCVHVSICAFNPSTNESIHVNRQHNAFNPSHHHVCTSTTTCMSMHIYKSVPCVHVHQSLMYVHACIDFDPCMCIYVNCQHKPYASMVTCLHVSICAFDSTTNASIHVNRQHNALSTITSVHKCQHRIQPKSSSCVYIDNNLYVYAHLQQKSVSCVHVHQSLLYVHACIAFDPCMCVYVNRQHKPMVTCVNVQSSTQCLVDNNLCA